MRKNGAGMNYTVKRKIQEIGGSYLIALPKLWCETVGLRKGNTVLIIFNGELKIKPHKIEEAKKN